MTDEVLCSKCSPYWLELRNAINKANRDVMKYGTADPTRIKEAKTKIAACRVCSGTGKVPGSSMGDKYRRDVLPAKQPKPKTVKPAPEPVPADAIAAALDQAAATTKRPQTGREATRPQVTGYCNECQKQIVWGRIYCGGCAAARDTHGINRRSA